MRILPMGPRPPLLKRAHERWRRLTRPPQTAMEFMEAVVVAERERQYRAAGRLCERGLERFPDDFYLLMKRLAQARSAGDRSLAEGLLERAVKQCPETAATFCSVGEEYAYLGQMETAESYFRRALDRTPGNSLIREKLAMALVQQRRMDEAIPELTAALDSEPQNIPRRNLLAQTLLAAERYAEVAVLLENSPEESLSWEALMCLSAARARLAGADELAGALLGATEDEGRRTKGENPPQRHREPQRTAEEKQEKTESETVRP